MAEKRMFAKTIIDSDAFLDMPLSAQALYFHLVMRADDDGFVNAPKKVQRVVGASDDDAKILIAKRFLIPFDSGVIVIKHWRIHNVIRADRKHETAYQEELAMLTTKGNGAYTLRGSEDEINSCPPTARQLPVNCPPNGGQTADERRHSIDKNSIDKIRLDKDREVEGAAASPYTGGNALRRPVFQLEGGKAYAVSDEQFAEWAAAFPTLDVAQALRAAAAKNNAQGAGKRKNVTTIEPYIVNWLILEQAEQDARAKQIKAKEKQRNGFANMPEHEAQSAAELTKELRGRNGNLL